MADKKGAGPISKKVEIKKAVTINGPTSKVVTLNGPTSKQAFRKVEEEQRARLAKQRKAEEEWLHKIIEKEEGRKKRIQVNFLPLDKFHTRHIIHGIACMYYADHTFQLFSTACSDRPRDSEFDAENQSKGGGAEDGATCKC